MWHGAIATSAADRAPHVLLTNISVRYRPIYRNAELLAIEAA